MLKTQTRQTALNVALPLVLALVAACGAARAQQEPPLLKLTLREAVNLALKQNPQVIIANLNVSESEQDRLVARSSLLPQLGASANEVVRRQNIEAAFGQRFPNLPQHIGPFWAAQVGVNFNIPVFDLTLWRRYQASKQGVNTSRAQESTMREESVLLVVSQYLGCQRAAADVKAADSRVELAQALYDQAADLQKGGVGTGIDTLRSNVQLQNAKQRAIVARTQLETALYGLARLLNLDPRQKIEIADQVGFFDTPAFEAEKTLEQAYQARPELRRIASLELQAETAKRAAADARLPRLSLNGGWAQQGLTPGTPIPVYQYQAVLEFPLFTGGRIQAERARADLDIQKLKQQEQEARNRIAFEVKTAVAQLESARGEVTVANLGEELARQEVEQARDRFQAGVANNIEIVTAQDELARAADNQIGALYRYNQARADLSRAVGQMEVLYTK